MALPRWIWKRALAGRMLCRGCLAPIAGGDAAEHAEAGLCGRCWQGLVPLPDPRCPRCALGHDPEAVCPEPVEWTWGDALWDYHGGRPPLGALLVPGIKGGERGWKTTLLRRAEEVALPPFARDVDLVTVAPTAFHRRLLRGFDLAEEAARLFARRIDRPFRATLSKSWMRRAQFGLTQGQRRRLPGSAISLQSGAGLGTGLEAWIQDRRILLVDDVWTTGTTLLRCAQALRGAGAAEVRVLTLFRAL